MARRVSRGASIRLHHSETRQSLGQQYIRPLLFFKSGSIATTARIWQHFSPVTTDELGYKIMEYLTTNPLR